MPTNQARTDTVRRSRMAPMSDKQLTAFLGRKIYQAMNDEDGDLSDARINNLNRYLGELYGNERDGYSKFTTREVLETVEWVLPSVLRVFLGSDKVVAFEPQGPDDEEQADQETDVVNYKLLRANGGDGFLALHHFFKDALMFPNAYIKAYVDEKEKVTEHSLTGIDSIALMMVEEDEANEILSMETRTITAPMPTPDVQAMSQQPQQQSPQPGQQPPPPPPQQPQPLAQAMQQIEVYDIKYRRRVMERKLKIEPIPGEEALIDNDCTSVNIDTADFSCHRVRKAFTELVQEGFDRDLLERVGTYEDFQWNDERTNRLFYEDEDPDAEDEDDPSMRRFWVHDCYAYVDVDGDGIAEFRHIVLIGTTVFVNEVVDYQPMVAMSSILIPHKHNGVGIADIVNDLQELRTTLTRQLLDNIYKVNIRRKIISEDSLIEDGTTMEAMLNVQSEWIPVRGPAANAIMPEQTQSIVGEILPVLQHLDERTANRTGINPQVNLNPEVLQQSTMGAFMGALEQASQRVEMLVRIYAETGIKQLMRKVHKLIRNYPDIATTIKLRNQWITVDPESWRDRVDLNVNVGLGFNNKQQMAGLLVQLLEIQQQAAGQGLATEREIYNTLEKLVEASSIGDVTRYFKDPSAPGWQPPQPPADPQSELYAAQARALDADSQRKAQEIQQEGQLKGQEMQLKGQESAQKGNIEQMKAQNDVEKARIDAEVKRQELDIRAREITLKEREMDIKERELLLLEERTMEEVDRDDRTAVAEIDRIEADTTLKEAQAASTRSQSRQNDNDPKDDKSTEEP